MRRNLTSPKHYYKEFKKLIDFIVRPKCDAPHELSTAQKIQGTWTLFVVKMVLAIIIGVAIGIIYDPENKTTSSMAERFSPATLFIVGVFILPLLEEVAFRLSLKFKPVYLALTMGVLAYYISCKAIYYVKLSDAHDNFDMRLIIVLVVFFTTLPLFSIPKIKKVLTQYWKVNFRWILYTFCVGFAWMHIFNYEITVEHLLLMPLITLPKLVSAFCYGYVRVNYGFIYSCGIHICTNSFGLLSNILSGGD